MRTTGLIDATNITVEDAELRQKMLSAAQEGASVRDLERMAQLAKKPTKAAKKPEKNKKKISFEKIRWFHPERHNEINGIFTKTPRDQRFKKRDCVRNYVA